MATEQRETRRLTHRMPIPYTRIRELNIWTLSNFLSVLRVLLLPFIYWGLFSQSETGHWVAVGLMLAAVATDVLDGWMARLRHTISSFGKIIDPIADKICLGAVMLFLILLRSFPVWLLGVLVLRDLWILIGGALLIRKHKIVFPSNIWGKLYSFSVALLIAAYTLRWPGAIINQLQVAVILLTATSAFSYTRMVFRYHRTHKKHQRRGRRPLDQGGNGTDSGDTGSRNAPGAAAQV